MTTTTRDGITLHHEVSESGPAIALTLYDGSLFTHQVAALERTAFGHEISLRKGRRRRKT